MANGRKNGGGDENCTVFCESQLAASWSLSERALQSRDGEEQLQRDGKGAGMSSAALQGCEKGTLGVTACITQGVDCMGVENGLPPPQQFRLEFMQAASQRRRYQSPAAQLSHIQQELSSTPTLR
ncbi:hypothetical protein Q8A67_019111 [Cirrhinus molitorella]|uniref:Uncharacterized protein n=1 Tax=Cirrhinus molitorella TaxID=172907 RepID=A0AA88TER8_9TELE|nr:hypothetical protein Q8A67_019111 [Cirrhinus molitorella]